MSERQSIIPTMRYEDAASMIEWLCRAFGFEKRMVVPAEDGKVPHAELVLGGAMIMLGSTRDDELSKYLSTPRKVKTTTQAPYVVVADAKAHYARAKAEGAEIVRELHEEGYGGWGYGARDPEGHLWYFGTYDPWA